MEKYMDNVEKQMGNMWTQIKASKPIPSKPLQPLV